MLGLGVGKGEEGLGKVLDRPLAKKASTVTVSLGDIQLYAPYSRSQHRIPDEPLMVVSIPSITIPLTTRRYRLGPSDDPWLTLVSIPILVYPNSNTTAILEYLKDGAHLGRILATVTADSLTVDVGDGRAWWSPPPMVRPGIEKILKYECE